MLSAILIPLDGSPLAERALPFADRLARAVAGARKARVVLTRVVPVSSLPDRQDAAATTAQEYLDRIASRLASTELVSETAVLRGDAPTEILEAARIHNADLVVMSTHGRSGIGRWLEFNERFRCADVAAEVAFLAMDLDHLGRADLGQAFVEAYVRRSGDAELPSLLHFYKCYRAFVRGKVLDFRLGDPRLRAPETERIAHEARAYFDLAHAYTGQFARPMLLVSMGLPASGKTTLAHALAGRVGLASVFGCRPQTTGGLASYRPSDRRVRTWPVQPLDEPPRVRGDAP